VLVLQKLLWRSAGGKSWTGARSSQVWKVQLHRTPCWLWMTWKKTDTTWHHYTVPNVQCTTVYYSVDQCTCMNLLCLHGPAKLPSSLCLYHTQYFAAFCSCFVPTSWAPKAISQQSNDAVWHLRRWKTKIESSWKDSVGKIDCPGGWHCFGFRKASKLLTADVLPAIELREVKTG
jgi:hypothetical protein